MAVVRTDNDVKLTSFVDPDILQQIQDDFAAATCVSVTIRDLQGNAITRPSNVQRFCWEVIRRGAEGEQRCKRCNVDHGEEAAKAGGPIVYTCHAGLTDFAAPIVVDEMLLGYMLGGQVLPEAPDLEKWRQKAERLSRELGFAVEQYLDALAEVPILPSERIEAVARSMHAVVRHISNSASEKERIVQELISLHKVGQTLVSDLHLNMVLERIASGALEVLGADIVVVYRYLQDQDRFLFPPIWAGDIRDSESMQTEVTKGAVADLIVSSGKSHYAPDAQTHPTMTGGKRPLRDDIPVRFVVREAIASSAGIVLKSGDEVVGVMFVNYRVPRKFTDSERRTIELFANQAAIAVHNGRLYDALQRQLRELTTLQEIAGRITSTIDLTQDLQVIAESAEELVGGNAASSSIYLYDRGLDRFTPGAAHGLIDRAFLQNHRPRDNGLGREAIRKGEMVFSDDAGRINETMLAFGVRAVAAFPLTTSSGVVGLLYVHFRQKHGPSEGERRLLAAFADQAAVAIENTQQREEVERRLGELQIVRKLSLDLDAALGLDEVLALILQRAVDMLGAKSGSVMLLDAERGRLKARARFGRGRAALEEMRTFEVGEGIVGWVAKTGEPYLSSDVTQDEHFTAAVDGSIASIVAVPLVSKRTTLGVLTLDSSELRAFDDRGMRLLQTFAEHVVSTILNAERYERLRRSRAELDALAEIDRSMDATDILELILQQAIKMTDASAGNIMWLHETSGDLVMKAQRGVLDEHKGNSQRIGQGIVGLAAEHKLPVRVSDVTTEPWSGIYLGFIPNVRSELAVPMLQGDRLLGVVNLESQAVDAFHEDDTRLLQALAMQAVLAIQRAEQYKELQKTRAALEEEKKRAIGVQKLDTFTLMAANLAHRVGNEVGTIPIAARELRRLLSRRLKRYGLIEHYLDRIVQDSERFLEMAESLRKPFAYDRVENIDVNLLLVTALSQCSVPPNMQVIEDYGELIPLVPVIGPQLMDVFKNVLDNAVEAMGEEGILTVRSRLRGTGERPRAEVEISDTGPGIEEDELERIFTLFYSTKRERGLGLGLWWCRTVLQGLGGDIAATSGDNGACFRMWVPIKEEKQ